MIRHIVMFKIKDEYKDEIPQLVKNFYGMKGRIEGMLELARVEGYRPWDSPGNFIAPGFEERREPPPGSSR